LQESCLLLLQEGADDSGSCVGGDGSGIGSSGGICGHRSSVSRSTYGGVGGVGQGSSCGVGGGIGGHWRCDESCLGGGNAQGQTDEELHVELVVWVCWLVSD